MRRHSLLPFAFLLCTIFLLPPTADILGAQQPTVAKGKSGTAKKVSAAAAVKTAKKPATASLSKAAATKSARPTIAAKKQGSRTAAQSAAAKKSVAKQKTVGKGTSSSSARTAAVTKQTKTKVKTGKRTASGSSTAARKRTVAKQAVVSRAQERASRVPVSISPVAAGDLAPIEKQISARSVMVMDAESGESLFEKMADNPRQPASTIKIVTAMIALKSLRNDDVINVSRRAADMPSSKIFLDPNRNYQANDLINAVLLASANDASVALAEKIAGSEDKFATLMTLSAKMWGAKNTICRTASGLTADGQQSTARDLANLFRFAMQHDEFSRRMRERSICTSYGKTLRNHNKALWRLDGAVGGKTGYTIAARQTYVGQFSREGQTIVVAIMGSESMWADLEKLVDYGFRRKKQEQLAQVSLTKS